MTPLKRILPLLVLTFLFLAAPARTQTILPAPTPPAPTQPATQPTRPLAAISRVLIISVDGLRPDLALRAKTPALRALMADGAYTFWARTTAMSITLPSHTSMLTGVTPDKHGVTWNTEFPPTDQIYPKFPTLFEIAHHAGYTTALAAGKKKFDALAKPGSLDWVFIPAKTATDNDVLEHALTILHDHQPQVFFVHFPQVDSTGHAQGWATDEQIAAIENADTCIGKLLAAEKDANLLDSTLVIVSADHGGAGISHGPDDPRSRHIPWIALGPGLRKNYDLTRIAPLTVNTEDTFATAAYVLGLPLDPHLDGKPILQILAPTLGIELIHAR